MSIDYKTKRDIFDELKIRDISYNGNLSEIDFVNRLFNLKELPSKDDRYRNMEEDFWQHRINNYDWDYWWIIDDDRLNIVNDDSNFGIFLCAILHPMMRVQEEVYWLLDLFNSYLLHDGYKIIEDKKVYNGSIFRMEVISSTELEIENDIKTDNEFVNEQYLKIDKKIKEEDFSGVITNSRTLIECTIGDIYKRVIGVDLEQQGNLQDGYKKIKTLLRLNPDDISNDAFKSILRSFVTIIDGLDSLSNQAGDRHRPFTKAERAYALFCANSAKIFVNFLYGILQARTGQKENIYEEFIVILNSNLRLSGRDNLLADKDVQSLLARTDKFLRIIIKNKLINDFQVSNYRNSDIFFAFLNILLDDLVVDDINLIFTNHRFNGQACGLHSFLKNIQAKKPNLIDNKDINSYILAKS